MLKLPTPNTSFEGTPVTIEGITYIFTYRYNTRSDRWKLDIADTAGNTLIDGLTIVEETILTEHLPLNVTWDGDIICAQLKNGDPRVGRDNFGRGKTHELIFVSNSETF